MFVVGIKTVHLDSYGTGHEQSDVRTDGALDGRTHRVQGHAVGLSIESICNVMLCRWMNFRDVSGKEMPSSSRAEQSKNLFLLALEESSKC